MNVTVEAVVAELIRLQKNRGLQSGDLGRKVGPLLASLTGYQPERGLEGRNSLTRQLLHATAELSTELRMIFTYAIAARAEMPSVLSERLASAGELIDRSPRVARRRLDEANVAVAGRLIASADGDRGWFHGELSAEVDFHDERPVYRARHTVVVTAPTLDHLTEIFGLYGVDDDVPPEVEITGQASLREVRKIAPSTWEFALDLNEPRSCGALVHYTSAVKVASRRLIEPMQVVSPRRDCWRFTTTLDFAGLAAEAWLLDGVTVRAAMGEGPVGTPLQLHGGPVRAEFKDLTPGLVYGVKWRWADPDRL